jgi:hypothetical protein
MGASYWIPQLPMLRQLDAQGHVLSERAAAIRGLQVTPEATAIDVEILDDAQLDWVVWRFPSTASSLVADLVRLAVLSADLAMGRDNYAMRFIAAFREQQVRAHERGEPGPAAG